MRPEDLPPPPPRVCRECGEEKPGDQFRLFERGRSRKCKACTARQVQAYQRTEEGQRAVRRAHLKAVYNISLERYEQMLAEQGGVCAICGQPEDKQRKTGTPLSLSVDHDHRCCPGRRSCGECVRRLLCINCNFHLAWSEKYLGEVLAYLADFEVEEVRDADAP